MQAQVTPVDLTCLGHSVSAPFTQQRLHSFCVLPVKCRPPPKLVGAVLHQKSLSPEPYLKWGRVNKAHRGNIIFTKAHCECQPLPARLRWHVSQEPNKKWPNTFPVIASGRRYCCHMLWQISNREGCFSCWLRFITLRTLVQTACPAVFACVQSPRLICSLLKAPPPPPTTSKSA